MNVLEHYDKQNITIGDAIEIDDETHFCKLTYKIMPLVIKTNKVCYLKKRPQSKNENYVNISITSKEYLEWFDQFYLDCIELFHQRSIDWFEEEMSLSDVEFAFINPLKSNIRNNCFDVMCSIDENRLHVVDSNDKIMSLTSLEDSNVVPTFHIKGIKFNTKHFMLEIELNNLYVLTDDVKSSIVPEVTRVEPVFVPESTAVATVEFEQPIPDNVVYVPELDEVNIDVEHLEEMEMNLEDSGVYKAYEIVNSKIKENIVEHLRTIFLQKKIKINNLDLSEMVDDEESDE